MFVINNASNEPIYEQIKSQMLSLISLGILRVGDKLPSIRTLALQLSLNVNTVKKAFSQLEEDGIILTVVGSGSYVAETACRNPKVMKKAEDRLRESLRAAADAGLTPEEINDIIRDEVKEERP